MKLLHTYSLYQTIEEVGVTRSKFFGISLTSKISLFRFVFLSFFTIAFTFCEIELTYQPLPET